MFFSFLLLSYKSFGDDYVIKKDHHYSSGGERVRLFRGRTVQFKAMFNESAKYEINDLDQWDINKLYGTSDCGGLHQEHSARFGWRWDKENNQLEIFAYTHVKGKFFFQKIDVAEINRVYEYKIELSPDKSSYDFIFNGKHVSMSRGCTDQVMSGYKIYPYFGGNQSAPHEIRIKINDQTDHFANFSIDLLYPNPTKEPYVFYDIQVEEDLDIGLKMFDMTGRLVLQTDTRFYSAGTKLNKEKLELPSSLSAGAYLIQPFALQAGLEKMGFISSPGTALKLILIK